MEQTDSEFEDNQGWPDGEGRDGEVDFTPSYDFYVTSYGLITPGPLLTHELIRDTIADLFHPIRVDTPRKITGWSHLVARTPERLHEFAQKIGLKRCWFRSPRGKEHPHYDIRGVVLARALKAGARMTSRGELIRFIRRNYPKIPLPYIKIPYVGDQTGTGAELSERRQGSNCH